MLTTIADCYATGVLITALKCIINFWHKKWICFADEKREISESYVSPIVITLIVINYCNL